jgi:hypothetical protein
MRAAGHVPDFTKHGAFAELEDFMANLIPNPKILFDELIVDEGQDFQRDWLDNLIRLVREPGRVWWLEDPMQNLYGRPPLELPGWVAISANINYRSPKDILGYLNRMFNSDHAIEAGSPLTGSEVEFLTYATPTELMDKTKTAITRGLGVGFKKPMMALVTFRGRERSLFTPMDKLGPHSLKSFTGHYDLLGNPIYNPGDLFIDSVYRFKGQAAPCIVFTEIDFDELDDRTLRKLFVGMTRATLKLILVLSENAARTLMARL